MVVIERQTTYDCAPTLTDEQILRFTKDGVLEGFKVTAPPHPPLARAPVRLSTPHTRRGLHSPPPASANPSLSTLTVRR